MERATARRTTATLVDPRALDGAVVLFDRAAGLGPPALRPVVFEPYPYAEADAVDGEDDEDNVPF